MMRRTERKKNKKEKDRHKVKLDRTRKNHNGQKTEGT